MRGKSRIIRELFSYLDDQPELVAVWRHGRCLPYGEGVTFWALGEIVKAQAGILESDDARTARTKLSACLPRWSRSPARPSGSGRNSSLVGLADTKNDGVEQTESFSAVLFLEAIASQRPLVIAIEDLHSAQAMIDFIRHVLDWSTGSDADPVQRQAGAPAARSAVGRRDAQLGHRLAPAAHRR